MSAAPPMVFATGFLTSLALIAAIGAQNAFVLRQGIRREHVGSVVTVAKLGGAAFLIGYGALAARRALRPASLDPAAEAPARLTGVLVTCLALTFLNPHVYLDTVVLLGALANEYREGRWLFGVGAVTASVVWFATLGFGATRLSALFARPSTWRVLDGTIAVTMVALGLYLASS